MVIPDELQGRWIELDAPARAHLDRFLQPRRGAADRCVEVVPAVELPPLFARDLVEGAPLLGAAFPGLRRTLGRITRHRADIAIRVECEGPHDGAFFGIVRASHRPVAFAEEHRLQLVDGKLRDRVSIDVAAIIRQLH